MEEIDGNMSTWIYDNMSTWFYLFTPVTVANSDTFRQCRVVWLFFVRQLEVRLGLITRSWAWDFRISDHACCSADTMPKRKDDTKGLSDVSDGDDEATPTTTPTTTITALMMWLMEQKERKEGRKGGTEVKWNEVKWGEVKWNEVT